ncbi:MAG TPA: ABC transporter substrate-binding protein/permease [Pirellulales bacterium]|nr:ABC transporter substrate-binding protein/permease [Pirellulales bacterium]
MSLILASFSSFSSLRSAEPDWTQVRERLASGVLRWAGDVEGGAPFQVRDPRDPNRVIGFEVDLADALAATISRRMDAPLVAEFVQYEWVSLTLGLQKGDFDVIMSGFEISEQNRAGARFSRPYYIYAQQLAVRHDDRRIHSLSDCRDKLVGTMAGTAAERLLDREGIANMAFDGQVEPYLDLELGRLDAVLLDAPIVTYYAATNPKLKLVGRRIGHGSYGVAARPGDQELVAAIDEALGELIASGKLAKILRRWHLWNIDQAALARQPDRLAELKGLGFDPGGRPLDDGQFKTTDMVDVHIIASSAQLWTFGQYAPLLLRAAGMTVLITLSSMAVAVVVGLIVAICRLYGPTATRWLALVYVEFFRGIPLLLLLFFLYYALPEILPGGLGRLSALATAVIGFGLNYAAYEAEVYRGAILSVPTRQWDAARALGMTDALAFRRVIFPQAFRTALGPMTNDFVALFKDTSLVSVIAIHDLTKEYLILSRSSLKFVELGLLTAAIYLAMSVPLGYLSRYLERKWGPR